jgi:hypothetical protein
MVGIIVGSIAAVLIVIGICVWYCLRQRRDLVEHAKNPPDLSKDRRLTIAPTESGTVASVKNWVDGQASASSETAVSGITLPPNRERP